MNLPQINLPTHTLTLPSNGKEISFRPSIVSDLEAMHLSRKEGDTESNMKAFGGMIASCTDGKVNVDSPFIDFIWTFLQIRSKSQQDILDIKYQVDEDNPAVDCTVDFNDIKVVRDAGYDNIIKLNDDIAVELRQPSITDLLKTREAANQFGLFSSLIEVVFDAATSYTRGQDFNQEDIEVWIGSMLLTKGISDKFEHFFKTMPRIEYELTVPLGDDKTKVVKLVNEDFFLL